MADDFLVFVRFRGDFISIINYFNFNFKKFNKILYNLSEMKLYIKYKKLKFYIIIIDREQNQLQFKRTLMSQ